MVVLSKVCNASHILYKTSGSANTFDCVESWDNFESTFVASDTSNMGPLIPYCRRLAEKLNPNLSFPETKTTNNGKTFTFDQLRQMNVSSEQLLKWHAPMDIIDEYASEQKTGVFFNCSTAESFWFGTHCQYTFDSGADFADIIRQHIAAQTKEPDNILSITNGTCYLVDGDQCNSVICLDWREICDGMYRF